MYALIELPVSLPARNLKNAERVIEWQLSLLHRHNPTVRSPQLSGRLRQSNWSTKAVIGVGKMRDERTAGFAKRKRLNERQKS